MLKNNKKLVLIIISGIALVAIALIGYFVITPMVQINGYKQNLASQDKINDSINAISEMQTVNGTQSATNAEYILSLKQAAKKGKEKAKDLENALSIYSSKLTSFSALPLLDFNGSYKNAISLRAAEQEYLNNAQEYLKESQAIFDYADSMASFIEKYQDLEDVATNLQNASTIEELKAQLDTLIAKFDAIINDLGAIAAPESFKNIHDTNLTNFRSLTSVLKDLRSALNAEDLDRMTRLSAEFEASANKMSLSPLQQGKDILENSKIFKLSDSLKQSQRDIEARINSL